MEVLTLGFPDEDGALVLVKPDKVVRVGGRLFRQHRFKPTLGQRDYQAREVALAAIGGQRGGAVCGD